jgi:hypothetical protein
VLRKVWPERYQKLIYKKPKVPLLFADS